MAVTISLDSSQNIGSSNSLHGDDSESSGVPVYMPSEDSWGHYAEFDSAPNSSRTRKQGSKYDSTRFRPEFRNSRSIYPEDSVSVVSRPKGTRKAEASKLMRHMDIQNQEKACDAVLRPDDQAKDITMHLDMNGAVELSDELAHFQRLNVGTFQSRHLFLRKTISFTCGIFPQWWPNTLISSLNKAILASSPTLLMIGCMIR